MSEETEKRFTEVFHTLLKLDPDKAPGPTAINEMMGRQFLSKPSTLSVKETKLRRKLLLEAGFKKNPWTERWYRP